MFHADTQRAFQNAKRLLVHTLTVPDNKYVCNISGYKTKCGRRLWLTFCSLFGFDSVPNSGNVVINKFIMNFALLFNSNFSAGQIQLLIHTYRYHIIKILFCVFSKYLLIFLQ